jgi:putative transposase
MPCFGAGGCRRTFNERTGTVFNFLEMPTDIVFQVVLFRLRYKLSLRELPEIFSVPVAQIEPPSPAPSRG